MSTRAIIGMKLPDNSVAGLWVWNDGEGLLPLLQQNFTTVEEVTKLVHLGVISLICTSDEADEFVRVWEEAQLPETGRWISLGSIKAFQNPALSDCITPATYPSVEDAYGQDINFLYLFDPSTGEWSVLE